MQSVFHGGWIFVIRVIVQARTFLVPLVGDIWSLIVGT